MQPKKTTSPKTPMAFKVALVSLVLGAIGVLNSLITSSFTTGSGEFSIGLFLLGVGEYINNPQVKLTGSSTESQSNKTSLFFSRRRNTSSLGNLFNIAGVLMIATGTASLFF
jgi:hypothetical protein